jgi:glycosyltransferase involved in cell wall biosynthesis
MKPLRLAFFGWGQHVHVERWAGYFASAGHEVAVLSLNGRGSYPSSVRQYVLHCARSRPALADAELRLLLWRLRPDLVHVHWAQFAVPVVRVWGGALAVTAWGSDIYRRAEFSTEQWSSMCAAIRRADFITCDSEDLARVLVDQCGVATSAVNVVHWGVDTQVFAPGGSDLATELGIADRRVVLSVRNFTPLYNQETVVDAFALAKKEVPSAFLLMKSYGGDPAYERKIRARIAARGLENDYRIVESIPYSAMPDLYRASHVSVSVPFSDATPVSLFEAMACGSFPIASRLPSLEEWIRNGENGFLVSPTDTEALARMLVRGLTDDAFRAKAIRSNRELVIARASQAMHMRRCECLYRDAIGLHATARTVVPA